MNTLCTFEEINFKRHSREARDIRTRVFIDEQGIPEHEEWDEYDLAPETRHLVARQHDGHAVGYVRVVYAPEQQVKLTRLAVLPASRGQGFGTALLREALKCALSQPSQGVFLHAQMSAIGLYERMGFHAEGPQFVEAGIVHQKFCLDLDDASNIENLFGTAVLRLSHTHDFVYHLQQCIRMSTRKISLSSKSLRQDIFANDCFIDAISRFVRQHRHAQIRILVQEPDMDSLASSALVALMQRLPSKIQIKVLDTDAERLASFMCADKHYLVFFNDERHTKGFCCYRARQESQSCLDTFERAWNYSAHSDPNLAQLSI